MSTEALELFYAEIQGDDALEAKVVEALGRAPERSLLPDDGKASRFQGMRSRPFFSNTRAPVRKSFSTPIWTWSRVARLARPSCPARATR